MAFNTSVSCSMSANLDEKNLSSIAQSAPWRPTGSIFSASHSPKRWDLVFADNASSADDAEDIVPTFADLASDSDNYSSADDGELGETGEAATPISAAACVYTIATLLHFRASVCDDVEPAAVRYGSEEVAELPISPKSKQSIKSRAGGQCEESWWRADPSEVQEESWWGPLPQSSTESWVAKQRNRNPEEDESVTRAARSILNKLTVEKFDSLFEQLVTCGFKQPHHISILMHEVFEKATTQHHFIPMYADLCVKLEKDPRIVSAVEEGAEMHNFRRLLLNECQGVFEQLFESKECEAKECMTDEEVAFRRKQQALGNMKLIGQLLVHGMLSSELFVGCCEELLRKREQSPEALESLVALMMVAGPKFDKDAWQHYRKLQNILSDMALLTKNKSVPPRLRFLIRDVLDARAAGWPFSRNGCKTTGIGPSKLQDVKISQAEDAAQKSPTNAHKDWTPLNSDAKEQKETPSTPQQNLAKNAPWKAKKAPADAPPQAFSLVDFRRALNGIFNDLASDKNIPAAVQRIRDQNVPPAKQADQFVDILTRVVEERRGAVRRCELAFIPGLAAAQTSAFDRKECLAGIELFFRDVYGGLCNEVHRLPAIMKSEFIPTMANVLPTDELNKVIPATMRM